MLTDMNSRATVYRFNGVPHRFAKTPPPLVPCNPNGAIPYDLDRTDQDRYRLTLAAAGYGPEEIDVSINSGALRISGKRRPVPADGSRLHQGLSDRLDCTFLLLEPLSIAETSLSNGLLAIDLESDGLDPYAASKPSLIFGRTDMQAAAA